MRPFVTVFFLFLLLGCSSIKNIADTDCSIAKKKAIKDLSRYFKYNEGQGTYDLALKLDTLSNIEYKSMSDSLFMNDITPYKYSYEEVQIYTLGKRFEKLQNIECTITTSDIEKHFGPPTFNTNSKLSTGIKLYYYFNLDSKRNCYNIKNKNDRFHDCAFMSFNFNREEKLLIVKTVSFNY